MLGSRLGWVKIKIKTRNKHKIIIKGIKMVIKKLKLWLKLKFWLKFKIVVKIKITIKMHTTVLPV